MRKISRRNFLVASGAVAITAALSACGGSSSTASSTAASSAAASSAAAGPAAGARLFLHEKTAALPSVSAKTARNTLRANPEDGRIPPARHTALRCFPGRPPAHRRSQDRKSAPKAW